MDKVDAAPREPVTLLRALSKPGAMELFALAGRGISNSTDAMEELGLTRKPYYSRLRGLVDAGLVEGGDGAYRQTALGRIIHRRALHIMERACEGEDWLRLLDEMEAADVGGEVKEVFAKALADRGIVGFTEAALAPVRVIYDYEALVKELVVCIGRAEKSILIASKYTDSRVIDTMLKTIKRGVKIRTLSEERSSPGKLNRLRMILSPKILDALIYYLSNFEDLGEIARETAVPFSFCIVDGSVCFFELPDPAGDGFSLGFKVNYPRIGASFTDIFDGMWGGAKPNSLMRFAKKLKGEG